MPILFNIRALLICVTTGLLLVGFQNCSKVKIDSADLSANNTGLNTDTLPDGSSTDINQPDSPSSNDSSGMPVPDSSQPPAPAPGSEPAPAPMPTPTPGTESPMPSPTPMPAPTTPISEPAPVSGTETAPVALPTPAPAPGTSPAPTSPGNAPSPKVPATSPDEYRALCGMNASSSANVERALSSMRDSRGQIREISGLNGKIVVISDKTLGTNQLDLLTLSGGKIILCGLDVEEISYTHGNLILVDTIVQHCSKHSGMMRIVGTSVCKNVTSSKVNIKVSRKK